MAAAVTALATPITMRLARRFGIVDEPRERGLATRVTPLLGGFGILAGVLLAMLLWWPSHDANWSSRWHGIFIAAVIITFVGAIDDVVELPPFVKLSGQIVAAITVVHYGVVVQDITLPIVGALAFPHAGPEITVVGLVGMMNIVNFSDGVDGLAAGVCAIIAAALAIIAFDFAGRHPAGVLAAVASGAALGFLLHNFPPARSFMGDAGANLLGLLMGCVAVEASVKTTAAVSFVMPLMLLTVPFLDTTFVVLKRLKYHRPFYEADSEHFHHRMARIGFSARRTIAYLYAWTLSLAGLAIALRFVPYSDHHGHLRPGWSLVMGLIALGVLGASVYLVYVLEILKFRRLAAVSVRRLRPTATPAEVEQSVVAQLETGEFDTVAERKPASAPAPQPRRGEAVRPSLPDVRGA
ncbi:MAG TPA: MraY family glycosyltransferase [Solirubrobacteraceae bacterium]|nr:MraY family glycosyltransferase [Solirubrobacteraceae bacterium]